MKPLDLSDIPWPLVRVNDAAVEALSTAFAAAVDIHMRKRGKNRNAVAEALTALAETAALPIAKAGADAGELLALHGRALAAAIVIAGPLVGSRPRLDIDARDDAVLDLPRFLARRQ